MVRTHSTMLPLGTSLPPFELEVVKGSELIEDACFQSSNTISNNMLGTQPVLLMILCSHCPFVKRVEPELVK